MNKIPETQLELIQLKRLAAQRQLYSDAKVIQAIQMGLCVLSPLILAWLVAYCFFPRVWAAFSGIIITCLFLFFNSQQQVRREKAAKIQELFDCQVLELEWQELMIGSRLETEIVEKYASKHKCKDPSYSNFKGWYPKNVGKLPLHLGRIVCQRSNCWWDAQLRRRYANWVVCSTLIVLIVVVTCLGFIGGMTFEKFILAAVNPLMPALVLGRQQYRDHIQSATRLDELKKYAEGLWDKALEGTSPEELTHNSRDLQNEIYNNRRRNPLIFNRTYAII